MDLILFIIFIYSLYKIGKSIFNIFLCKYTNVNIRKMEYILVRELKHKLFYFGVFLFIVIGFFNKVDSIILPTLFTISLLSVIYIELFYKKEKNVFN